MGRRRDALEGPTLELVALLRRAGEDDAAARLAEVTPETDSITRDELRPVLEAALRATAGEGRLPADLRRRAADLAAVAADPVVGIGRHGTVWISWADDSETTGDPGDAGYVASWQSDPGDADLYEDGPVLGTLADALAWARHRSDAVVVRPEWDEGQSYWAGTGVDPRGLPVLGEPPSR